MQHAGPPAGTERQAPCHSSVRQGSGAEEAAASGGGSKGELGDGLRGIQGSDGECNGVRYLGRVLTEVDDDCLAVVGNLGKARKSWAVIADISVGSFLQSGVAGGVAVLCEYVGA